MLSEGTDAWSIRHAALAARVHELSSACASRTRTIERLRGFTYALLDAFAPNTGAPDDDCCRAALEESPTGAVSRKALLEEHAELHEMLRRLLRTLDEPPTPERDEQVVVQIRDLTDLFRIHLRKEESVVQRLRAHARRDVSSHPFPRKGLES